MGHERLALLQLCDSLFPIGSFAHSDGLETAVAAGTVSSAAELRDWLDATLAVSLASCELPAVRDAAAAAAARDRDGLWRLDEEIEAMRTSAAGRDAAQTMGTRLLKTWREIRPSGLLDLLGDGRARFTFPVAFGAVCVASGIEVGDALESYAYTRLAASISAAMRLMPLGQREAHALLARMLSEVPAVAGRVIADPAPPRSFAPLMDIAAMSHQYVHSRLFRS
jgi:urease accessory protein